MLGKEGAAGAHRSGGAMMRQHSRPGWHGSSTARAWWRPVDVPAAPDEGYTHEGWMNLEKELGGAAFTEGGGGGAAAAPQ
jgi:hypothetical protein